MLSGSQNTKARTCLTSPNGKHVASLVGERGGYSIVLDGKEHQKYDWIGEHSLAFSPDSNRIAYVAHKGDKEFVVVDGKKGRHYRDVRSRELSFSPDSKRLAYVVGKLTPGGETTRDAVVIDGRRGKFYDHIGSIAFSPNSRFLAYVAWNRRAIARTQIGDVRAASHFYLVVVQSTKYMRGWFRSIRAKRTCRIPGRAGFDLEFTKDSRMLGVVIPRTKEIVLGVRLDEI